VTAHHVATQSNVNRRIVRLAALAGLLGLIGVFSMTATAQSSPETQTQTKPTIVLVHGAWDNSSGWNSVIERLHAQGYQAIALPNPLRGVTSDAAYIASTLAGIPGPIVLVAHSYGGAVITNAAAGNANVKALVYVSAFIPARISSPSSASSRAVRSTPRPRLTCASTRRRTAAWARTPTSSPSWSSRSSPRICPPVRWR
jgi:pimeloyl-ACP methyl ester carboxylesterase